jgi:hypothetical protein
MGISLCVIGSEDLLDNLPDLLAIALNSLLVV